MATLNSPMFSLIVRALIWPLASLSIQCFSEQTKYRPPQFSQWFQLTNCVLLLIFGAGPWRTSGKRCLGPSSSAHVSTRSSSPASDMRSDIISNPAVTLNLTYQRPSVALIEGGHRHSTCNERRNGRHSINQRAQGSQTEQKHRI